ncbi:hypothetical protein STEG23_025497 [Scotinomys teguina]
MDFQAGVRGGRSFGAGELKSVCCSEDPVSLSVIRRTRRLLSSCFPERALGFQAVVLREKDLQEEVVNFKERKGKREGEVGAGLESLVGSPGSSWSVHSGEVLQQIWAQQHVQKRHRGVVMSQWVGLAVPAGEQRF